MELLQNTYFTLFLIITLGYLLGKIKVAGISLDVSAVLFVALVFGHLGYIIPKDLQKIGLILFIYSVGMQAGPGFFSTFKSQGRKFAYLGLVLIGSASLVTYLSTVVFDLDMKIAIGLLTGALTSTPGLAAAIDVTQSPLASIGYGIAYPFGVIGVILFVRLYPKFSKTKLVEAEKQIEDELKQQHPVIIKKNFIVENRNAFGKSLADLKVRQMTQGVVSRIMRNGDAFVPSPQSKLEPNDIIKVVGSESALNKIKMLIGPETDKEIPLSQKYDVRTILVSNKECANMTIGELNLLQNYGATITRIRRSGIDITPNKTTRLLLGDKVIVACDKENMKQVVVALGNDDKKLSDSDMMPVAIGIILGILFGKISISFTNSFSFSFGITGGVLFVALILSNIGKTGNILWTMSGAANQLIRQLGLLFFLSAVGTGAGAKLVETYNEYGIMLFVVGGLITLLPMIISALFSYFVLKLNLLELLGALTGGMTSTPGLAAVTSMTPNDAPQISYATIYPVAMVLLIIFVQIMSML